MSVVFFCFFGLVFFFGFFLLTQNVEVPSFWVAVDLSGIPASFWVLEFQRHAIVRCQDCFFYFIFGEGSRGLKNVL